MKELTLIQNELKVKKSRWNKHGSFAYRSTEDILSAVKPLLKKHELSLMLTDKVVNVGEHNYVRAKAILTKQKVQNLAPNMRISIGWAKEAEMQKGMQSAQLTGSTSSYARKYALSGLFLLDDSEEIDATETDNTPSDETWKKAIDKLRANPKVESKEAILASWTLTDEQITELNAII